jgi:hypothetical protein
MRSFGFLLISIALVFPVSPAAATTLRYEVNLRGSATFSATTDLTKMEFLPTDPLYASCRGAWTTGTAARFRFDTVQPGVLSLTTGSGGKPKVVLSAPVVRGHGAHDGGSGSVVFSGVCPPNDPFYATRAFDGTVAACHTSTDFDTQTRITPIPGGLQLQTVQPSLIPTWHLDDPATGSCDVGYPWFNLWDSTPIDLGKLAQSKVLMLRGGRTISYTNTEDNGFVRDTTSESGPASWTLELRRV